MQRPMCRSMRVIPLLMKGIEGVVITTREAPTAVGKTLLAIWSYLYSDCYSFLKLYFLGVNLLYWCLPDIIVMEGYMSSYYGIYKCVTVEMVFLTLPFISASQKNKRLPIWWNVSEKWGNGDIFEIWWYEVSVASSEKIEQVIIGTHCLCSG